MIDKLVSVDTEIVIRPKGLVSVGGFNDFPEPWAEVSLDEFYHQWYTHSPRFIDTRQVRAREAGYPFVDLIIFWDFKNGWGIGKPQKWDLGQKGEYGIHYTEPVKYFRFGCDHKWIETKRPPIPQSGDHESTCQKCGLVHGYDTSD